MKAALAPLVKQEKITYYEEFGLSTHKLKESKLEGPALASGEVTN